MLTTVNTQEIAPVPLTDFFDRISVWLSATIGFLWQIAPTVFISAFVLGLVVALAGAIMGSRSLKGAGITTVSVSLLAYALIMATPLIFGVLRGFAVSAPAW